MIVDDLLPCDENDKLIYCRNKKSAHEFCLPLLEKAYAKLAACYEFLNTGDPGDAMIDLTGAVNEMYDLEKCVKKSERREQTRSDVNKLSHDEQEQDKEKAEINESNENSSEEVEEEDDDMGEETSDRQVMNVFYHSSSENIETVETDDDDDDENEFNDDKTSEQSTDLVSLWSLMHRSFRMKSLMNASFQGDKKGVEVSQQGALPNGLVPDHAYSVLQAIELGGQLKLVKLRNPYGNPRAWRGAWSPQSNEWRSLDSSQKSRYQMSLDPEGEFYMTFDDFVRYFDELNIAHLNVNAFSDHLSLVEAPPDSSSSYQQQTLVLFIIFIVFSFQSFNQINQYFFKYAVIVL